MLKYLLSRCLYSLLRATFSKELCCSLFVPRCLFVWTELMSEMRHLPGEILSFSWNSYVRALYDLRNLRSALSNTSYLKVTFLNFLIKKSVWRDYLIWYSVFISGYSHLFQENTNRYNYILNFPWVLSCAFLVSKCFPLRWFPESDVIFVCLLTPNGCFFQVVIYSFLEHTQNVSAQNTSYSQVPFVCFPLHKELSCFFVNELLDSSDNLFLYWKWQ